MDLRRAGGGGCSRRGPLYTPAHTSSHYPVRFRARVRRHKADKVKAARPRACAFTARGYTCGHVQRALRCARRPKSTRAARNRHRPLLRPEHQPTRHSGAPQCPAAHRDRMATPLARTTPRDGSAAYSSSASSSSISFAISSAVGSSSFFSSAFFLYETGG